MKHPSRPRRRKLQRDEAIELIRGLIEAAIGSSCNQAKPEWFKGHELDGYSEDKRIGYIYLTREHIHHSNAEPELINFLYIKSVDALKELYCALNRVALIEVLPHHLKQRALIEEKIADAIRMTESNDDAWNELVAKCKKRCRTVMCRYRAMRRKYIEAKGNRRSFPELELNMIYEDEQTNESRGSQEHSGEADGQEVPTTEETSTGRV